MLNSTKFLRFFIFLVFLYFSALACFAAGFTNPVLLSPGGGCAADNLRTERFASEVSGGERVKLCQSLDKITDKLNAGNWSPQLSTELKNIWRVFSNETVTLRPMPKETSSRVLAMAEAFPSGNAGKAFDAGIYVRPEKSDNASFFQVLLHELRHVLDFQETWKNKMTMNSMELERRAFLLMSKLTEETPEKEKLSGVPKFWKESWRKMTVDEICRKRASAIEKYLRSNDYYRNQALNPNRQALDFSYLKSVTKSVDREPANKYEKKDGERLPDRPDLPKTSGVLPQNIRKSGLDLEKPKNQSDPKEILRVALVNEKKLYYGMSNFVYDQKLAFQCWRKGKVSAAFNEDNIIARTDDGNALFQTTSFKSSASRCSLDSQSLKTDFTETFWASPAMEKMPVNFVGFVEVDGRTLARYTVLQPDAKLFERLANQFPNIRPFRVFVGTIFISPEDGQIVKFWGTSFPEDTITGKNERKVWGSYSVTALRQKLNIESGLWVTVYVGTAAIASIGGNSRPFTYTVKFENYRQSATDVKILDDENTQSLLIDSK